MIKLDGSYLEGGGQIVRTALALSVITGKSFSITDIRKARKEPGLKPQHLIAAKFAKELCDADVVGLEIGSHALDFYPKKTHIKNLNIDIGTAGSITLLMQTILYPCLFGNKIVSVKAKGGTDVSWSPSIDYFREVLLPQVKRYAEITFFLEKRGFYPQGGGSIKLRIRPKYHISDYSTFDDFYTDLNRLGPKIDLTSKGKLIEIRGISYASKNLMNASVAERQAKSAKYFLNKVDAPIKIRIEHCDTLSTGSGITLYAVFSTNEDKDYLNPVIIGADNLGEKGKKSELVGEEAAKKLLNSFVGNFCVDENMVDQILPLMALFSDSKITIPSVSLHAKANIYVIEAFLPVKFIIQDNLIECVRK
ncbi:MAG: RNA 3'-terminal phosphate cyclase [archaeon]